MKTLKGMRPYTAVAPLVRLVVGLVRLFVRFVLWCMAGEGAEKAWRALGAVVAAGTGYRAAVVYPMVMIPVTLLLTVLAWRAGDRPAVAEGGQPVVGVPPLDRDELAVAMHEIGAPHAHISALADHLKTTPARVREGCSLAGVPVAGGVRMKKRGVSTGVKAAHFPPLPSPAVTPSEGVVVAGQGATTTATGPTVTRSASGAQITVTPADIVVH